MCLALGHNTVPPVGNLGPLDSESDALPLPNRTPLRSQLGKKVDEHNVNIGY